MRHRRCASARVQRGQVVRDHAVVARRCARTPSWPARTAWRASTPPASQLGEHARIVRRVDRPRDVLPVLGRGAQHRRAADVDVLDRLVERAVGARHGLRERIQVDHQHVDRLDAVRVPAPPCAPASSRRASRPPWMRGCSVFTRPSSISGKPVYSATSVTGSADSASSARGAAGGQQRDAPLMQRPRELDDAGLVGDGDQRLLAQPASRRVDDASPWLTTTPCEFVPASGAACCG